MKTLQYTSCFINRYSSAFLVLKYGSVFKFLGCSSFWDVMSLFLTLHSFASRLTTVVVMGLWAWSAMSARGKCSSGQHLHEAYIFVCVFSHYTLQLQGSWNGKVTLSDDQWLRNGCDLWGIEEKNTCHDSHSSYLMSVNFGYLDDDDHVDGGMLSLGTAASNRPIFHPPGDIWHGELWRNDIDRRKLLISPPELSGNSPSIVV
jgi:hypothetical protein